METMLPWTSHCKMVCHAGSSQLSYLWSAAQGSAGQCPAARRDKQQGVAGQGKAFQMQQQEAMTSCTDPPPPQCRFPSRLHHPPLQVVSLYLPLVNGQLMLEQLKPWFAERGKKDMKDIRGLCFIKGRMMVVHTLTKAQLPYMSSAFKSMQLLDTRLFHLAFFSSAAVVSSRGGQRCCHAPGVPACTWCASMHLVCQHARVGTL